MYLSLAPGGQEDSGGPEAPDQRCARPQTLMIRDWWACTVVSVMFEFLEYSLEHQLPNFSECWWDHVGRRGEGRRGSTQARCPALREGDVGAGSP